MHCPSRWLQQNRCSLNEALAEKFGSYGSGYFLLVEGLYFGGLW